MIYTIEDEKIGKKVVLTPLENDEFNRVKEEYFEFYKSCNQWRQIGGYFLCSKEYIKEKYGIIID